MLTLREILTQNARRPEVVVLVDHQECASTEDNMPYKSADKRSPATSKTAVETVSFCINESSRVVPDKFLNLIS